MTKHITKVYQRSTTQARVEGLTWYEDAHNLAKELSSKYNLTLEQAAHTISALSPACSWEGNKNDAYLLCKAFFERGLIGAQGTTVRTYGMNKRKAIDILRGIRLIEEKSLKTWNFAHNIMYPHSKDYVTIDRHALRVYKGKQKRGNVIITPKQYKTIANAYKRTAKHLGLLPCELQAITWTQYRNELKG